MDATFESTFFAERQEVLQLIDIVSGAALDDMRIDDDETTADTVQTGEGTKIIETTPNEALARLRTILDKYLECPSLLDPSLEILIRRLSKPSQSIIRELFVLHTCQSEDDNNMSHGEETCRKLDTLMHLLSAIYAISKVRGRKNIQRLMPHDVADVEPVLAMLRWFGWMDRVQSSDCLKAGEESNLVPGARTLVHLLERNDSTEAKVWESINTLLTWLGILSLVPFDLDTIDSSTETLTDGKPMTLVQSILKTSASHLDDHGATRDTAAACLASLLSRPDLEELELEGFIVWSSRTILSFRTGVINDALPHAQLPLPDGSKPSNFRVMGVIQTLAAIFKCGHRSTLLSTKQRLAGVEALWEQCILLAECRVVNGSIILRKLLVKLFARIGCAYLPPRVATWRYSRGKRSLLDNLINGGNEAAQTKENTRADDSRSDVLFHVPDQVEDAMGQLLRSLTDSATIVRWSAAKGIGRLTERLPSTCADDVLDAILVSFADVDKDQAWHGACLALAELARRGLLLPRRLPEVVPLIVQSIGYDCKRGQHSVGSHVRDAACYTMWAFSRAYSPTILNDYIQEMSEALVVASLFDREVNCRRAASAAFQESVGRLGNIHKHGISILTTADYFALGNRNESFLTLAPEIAKFEEYQIPMIRHLADVKSVHWDVQVRQLASRSLAKISVINPAYIISSVLPRLLDQCFSEDLATRHGSLLAVAEVTIKSLPLDDSTRTIIADLIPSIEKRRLYRGRGGEVMRAAACRLIECISVSRLPLSVKQQVRLLDSIDACLVHPTEGIQKIAAQALGALMYHYFPVGKSGPSSRLQGRVVDKYIGIIGSEDNPAATRGFCLALGHLPPKLLAPSSVVLDSILSCLIDASRKDTLVGNEGDAETRRNALLSLVKVCTAVGLVTNEKSPSDSCPLNKCQLERVFKSMFEALQDYSTDRRGDVGSWSRMVAIDGIVTLAYLAIRATTTFPHSCKAHAATEKLADAPSLSQRRVQRLKPCGRSFRLTYFDENLAHSILDALLKQLGEKLDTVRCKAGESLERLLFSSDPQFPFVPHRELFLQAFRIGNVKTWSDPSVTFPLLFRVISIDDFATPILAGAVISVGGLTESVAKSSCAALFDWVKCLRSTKTLSKLTKMGEVLLHIFEHNRRNGRVILPLLVTMNKLMAHGLLDELIMAQDSVFVRKLMVCISSEAKRCTDVKRLLAIVDVSINLLHPRTHAKIVSTRQFTLLASLRTILSERRKDTGANSRLPVDRTTQQISYRTTPHC